MGRFTDDAPVSKSRLIEAELPQSWKGPGMGEELSQYGVLVMTMLPGDPFFSKCSGSCRASISSLKLINRSSKGRLRTFSNT